MSKGRWAEWFQHGTVTLGLRPKDFWQLSLWEWRSLIGVPERVSAEEALSLKRDLARLTQLHPDT